MPKKKQLQPKTESKNEIGYIKPREITEEMKDSYLDYAMSVIISRALPDVRDGLKPVHRRILYAMYKMGLTHTAKFRKSATVVGEVLGKFHPHGDQAVYDALVRMVQDFSLRYPLVQGQGNFGCFTRDSKVKLCDGRGLSFGDLIKEQAQGKRHWTFSFSPKSQKVEIVEIQKPRLTRKNEKIIEVILDNGEKIKCTLDHRFMLRNGSYKEAKNLKPGDSLMALTTKKSANLSGLWETTHSTFVLVDHPTSSITSQGSLSRPLTVNKKEAVEGTGLAPVGFWAINQNRLYAPPTVFSLHHNHKVINTKILQKREDVYDLTTEPWHNFLLDAGVFVHNSIDGDSAAAMRYSEAKLSKIGEEMLRDIEKETVGFMDNYDGTRKEPTVLPSPLPQLLLNGALGIAVGMATNIPPHNLAEVVESAVFLLSHPKADTEDLFNFINGPDFPTGGLVYNRKELITTYSQGKGPIVMRGRVEVVEGKTGQQQILITEIPFQVRKSSLLEQIANLAQQKKIEGVKDIRDESDREGLRVVLDLGKSVYPQKILNRLYKFTNLQKTFHLNMLALVDGIQPKVLSLAELLGYFLEHRIEVVTKRTKYNLERAKERAHILEGLHKALLKIDLVIKTIKASKNREDAQKNLVRKFKLTSIQANAILEMKLAILARLEREKIAQELKETLDKIKEFSAILKSPAKIKEVVRKELLRFKEVFGDQRRTKVYVQAVAGIAEEDLIPQEETIVTLTQGGYIKRLSPETYKIQKRGGKGILGMKTTGEDVVEHFLPCQTHDSLFFFTDSGKVFSTKAYELPSLPRVAKGRGLANFLEISSQEKILSIFPLSKKDSDLGINYLVLVTKNGIIKKTPLGAFENVRKSGLKAITLRKGDALRKVCKSTGKDQIILLTKKGQAIRIAEQQIRPMGRAAAGVRGIKLRSGDEVIGMEIIRFAQNQKSLPVRQAGLPDRQAGKIKNQNYLLVISENGYGKRTEVENFKVQQRGGVGVRAAQLTQKTGQLIVSKLLTGLEEDLIVISRKAQVIRIKTGLIPILGRATQGVKIMRLDPNDKVVSSACI